MPPLRYAQFCPVARAAEILGERWTALLLRDLTIGPQRFSDLRRRMNGISTSVLSQRLERLEGRGLVERRELPPPAGSVVYELTEAGRSFEPVLKELIRFGVRFLAPAEGDHLEPDWVIAGMRAFALSTSTPSYSYRIEIDDGETAVATTVRGGPGGTSIGEPLASPPDATLRLPPLVALGLLSGGVDPVDAAAAGVIEASGDPDVLRALPQLFEAIANPTHPQGA